MMNRHDLRLRRAPHAAAKVLEKLRSEGPDHLVRRAVRRAYQHLDAGALDFGLLPGDVVDSAYLDLRTPPPRRDGGPIRVGWVCTPPAAGSGGHTTMFRMVRALEEAGHECHVLLYDRHGGNSAAQAEVIRAAWPWVSPHVRSVREGLGGLDVVVATGWESAHVLAGISEAVVHRAYFIQDYEPLFYPRGTEHALAEDTYRFGFTNIALGSMVAQHLAELGVDSREVDFGRDVEAYTCANAGERSGVAFYARPGIPRRGYRLGLLALQRFHELRPDQEIHLYGATVGDVGFPVTEHGTLSPEGLNDLYNACAAGLVLSFTNVSLVPDEMLAAGCVPVVNDTPETRAVFDNPHAVWSRPTPFALAAALAQAVEQAGPERSAAAATSVRGGSWDPTGRQVVEILEGLVRDGSAAASPGPVARLDEAILAGGHVEGR
jgi:O-antigen biosynthesis protein